jgi:hypothetical protein
MLNSDGNIRLTPSPFLKVVLVIIAAALCLIALRGFWGPSSLYAQSGSEMDVNIKSVGGWLRLDTHRDKIVGDPAG